MYGNKANSHPDRTVNIYQPYVRPVPRGKDKGRTEFGARLGASEPGGFCRLDRTSWDAYNGPKDLMPQAGPYKDLHGYCPGAVPVDKVYLARANRNWLKSKGIRHCGKPLGRPKPLTAWFKQKSRRERNMRNHVEGRFGQGKNAHEPTRARARRKGTSESWIAAIFFIMNLKRWLKTLPLVFCLMASQILWWVFLLCPRKHTLWHFSKQPTGNPVLDLIKIRPDNYFRR